MATTPTYESLSADTTATLALLQKQYAQLLTLKPSVPTAPTSPKATFNPVTRTVELAGANPSQLEYAIVPYKNQQLMSDLTYTPATSGMVQNGKLVIPVGNAAVTAYLRYRQNGTTPPSLPTIFTPGAASGGGNGGGNGGVYVPNYPAADKTLGRVDTSRMSIINVGNTNDLLNLLASDLTDKAIKLQDGDYLTTADFAQSGAWNNVKLYSDSGNARLMRNNYSTVLIMTGNKTRKQVCLEGFKLQTNYSNSSNTYQILWWNELPTIDGLEFSNLDITGPQSNSNGIGSVQYSTASNQGATAKNIWIHNNNVHDVGRCGAELLSQGYDGVLRLTNMVLENNTFSNLGIFDQYGMAISISAYCQQIGLYNNNATGTRRIGYELVNAQQVIATGNNLSNGKDGVGWGFSDDNHGLTQDILVRGGTIIAPERPFYLYDSNRIHLDGQNQLWKGYQNVEVGTSQDCVMENMNIVTRHSQLATGFNVVNAVNLTVKNSLISTAGAFNDTDRTPPSSNNNHWMPANESVVIRNNSTGCVFDNVQTIIGQNGNGQTIKGNTDTNGGNGAIVNLAGSTNVVKPNCTFSTAP